MEEVTLVITSCGRFELLKQTIISFFKFNTYPIKDCIVIDDSGTVDNLDFLKELIPVPFKLIINPENLGQIKSIDIAYEHVTTPYIFHCEDDWEFYESGFIEESFKILNYDPAVITVWLRSHTDTNKHPIEDYPNTYLHGTYFYLTLGYKNKWNGFTFNPGLRRTADVMKLWPYINLVPVVRKKKQWIMGEADLSIYFHNLGYRGAITSNTTGFVKHIGWDDHISLPWEKINAT